MEERWGKWVSLKCMCEPESFFSNGICGHSMLMALLYDSSLEFPTEWSTQQLPSNGKSKKRPTAWAEFHEEEARPTRTERWTPTLLGEEDMIINKSLMVLGNFIHFPWQCLISASWRIGDDDTEDEAEEAEEDDARPELQVPPPPPPSLSLPPQPPTASSGIIPKRSKSRYFGLLGPLKSTPDGVLQTLLSTPSGLGLTLPAAEKVQNLKY